MRKSVLLAVIPEEILLTTDTPPAPACDPRLYPLAEYDLLMEKKHSWSGALAESASTVNLIAFVRA